MNSAVFQKKICSTDYDTIEYESFSLRILTSLRVLGECRKSG